MPDVQYPDDPISNPSTIRIEDLLGADDEAASPLPEVPVREGLPRTFRMRADKHYVEMLDGSPQRQAATESSAPATVVAARTETTTEESDSAATAASIQAGRDLAQSLAALRVCTNLLSDRGPALPSTVAANLIRAEAWRAACLLQASRFLRGEISPTPKPVQAQTIVDQVRKAIEPERRLRGITLDEQFNLGNSRIVVDEELLVGALSGLLMATLSLTEDASDVVVAVSAGHEGSETVFAISQTHANAPSNWASQSVLVLFATRLLSASGGRLTVAATGQGSDVRIALTAVF